jgi:hypothetical protein
MTHFPSRPRRSTGTAGAEPRAKADVLWGRPVFRAPRLVLRPAPPASPFAGARPPRPPSGPRRARG